MPNFNLLMKKPVRRQWGWWQEHLKNIGLYYSKGKESKIAQSDERSINILQENKPINFRVIFSTMQQNIKPYNFQ